MILGFGWVHLLTSREKYSSTPPDLVDDLDDAIDVADREMWSQFRSFVNGMKSPWFKWKLHERLNNHTGLLTFSVSRNHRSSVVWDVLDWIEMHALGSYGLFYVHDDEDSGDGYNGRTMTNDYSNVFRVHRIKNGSRVELPDPFFGEISPEALGLFLPDETSK